jgi:hypothetical protein
MKFYQTVARFARVDPRDTLPWPGAYRARALDRVACESFSREGRGAADLAAIVALGAAGLGREATSPTEDERRKFWPLLDLDAGP